MKKPVTLRKLLEAVVPGVADNPDQLSMFVEAGQIRARAGDTLSFEYRYDLKVLFEDYAGEIDAIVVPILAWIEENQPDLLRQANADPFRFVAELQDEERADVEISIALTEPVIVRARPGGGYTVDHVAPAPPISLDRFDGVPCGTKLLRLVLGEDVVAQSADYPG